MSTERVNQLVRLGLIAFFSVSVFLISYTLITEHVMFRWLYLLFPISLFTCLFSAHRPTRTYATAVSLLVLFVGGWIEPLELDAIEESFILLPLVYVYLFPGALWPIVVALVLVGSYWINIPAEDFDEFIEDSVELIFIACFATVMTYYQQKSLRQSLRYKKASLTDYLTQLPNRKSFFQASNELTSNQQQDYAVLQLGLDNLKGVNDSLGYGYGDALLTQFSSRVVKVVDDRGDVYRLGGDELVVIVPCSRADKSVVEQIVEQLTQHYDSVCHVFNTSHRLRFSIGVALLSDAQNNVNVWGKNADAAVARAKKSPHQIVRWYDDELMDETIRDHQIEVELNGAIDNQQLFLVYQPKVDLTDNSVVGAEALLRWNHPDLGIVPPLDFISIAERTAQIIPIGRWVLEQAILQAREWQNLGCPICVSVNVSSVQFAHDDIYPYIEALLTRHRLAPELLQIEITETAMMDKHTHVAQTCHQLQQLGVSIAIDDFGIAYSSLSYLKQLPLDVIKIDKSFIDECVEQTTDHMIVRTIIQIGNNLNKVVIAEGVENEQQRQLLQKEQCHLMQGYLFSKPLTCTEFSLLLTR
ncbi:putative bifunctional diguanylate cyclase/phosphodiesterase [Vibrio sp. JPW-9-11-11]|uniref:putative bifunctional diguanylate cyclase/phosphodiesterase n=1 Tax=Vibrio sp. JPW-9-11-11 TaxID=1416532 RepID=UPI0034E86721